MRNELELISGLIGRIRYEDGGLYWVSPCQKRNIGKQIGTPDKNGYLRTHARQGHKVSCHRIIFFMFNGYLPEYVDHIDGNLENNRIENLREATICQNMQNCKLSIANKTGIKGVHWQKSMNKWAAGIRENKRWQNIGYFSHIFEAACARRSAELSHYGEFSR